MPAYARLWLAVALSLLSLSQGFVLHPPAIGSIRTGAACSRLGTATVRSVVGRRHGRMTLQMDTENGNKPEGDDAAAAAATAAADGEFYFTTRVSDKSNVKMYFELLRNQLLLGLSCYWTLSGACAPLFLFPPRPSPCSSLAQRIALAESLYPSTAFPSRSKH